jgi:hypothetical protein
LDSSLVWPPRKEDLERMYLDERLSASKIAAAYGLKYASPKTAESTILHHLKRNGIERRDAAEHIRKVTTEMVDSWVARYEKGESLKQIAGDQVEPATVWSHLRRRGVKLRDKVEAQIAAVTKYPRPRFQGSPDQEAYLLGFVWGDCSVERHGRAVRVRSGSTHPAFVELFDSLFEPYGHVRHYPKESKVTRAELILEIDLHGSFDFLLQKQMRVTPELPDGTEGKFSFLAGFLDAEGSIGFHRKVSPSFEVEFTNKSNGWVASLLVCLNFHPKVYHKLQKAERFKSAKESDIWTICLYRRDEVKELLSELPLRHPEKIVKSQIALGYLNGSISLNSAKVPIGWSEYIDTIARTRNEFVTSILANLKVDVAEIVVSRY